MERYQGLINLARNDGSIITNKNLIFVLGRNAAEMFTELLGKWKYFAERDKLTEDGYFYNTVDNMYLDTGLKKDAQIAAVNKLIDKGLIKKDNRGLPPKRHFKITATKEQLRKYIKAGANIRKQEAERLAEKNSKDIDRYMEYLQKQAENADMTKISGKPTNKGRESRETNIENTDVNNTNLKDTNVNNTKVYGRKQVSHPARFTYEEIKPQLNVSIESNELIQYFVDRYEFYIEREHPRLTAQQWNRVAETFNKDYITVIDEMDREKFIDINKAMIDNYYQTSFGKEVDYCILHFIEPQILLNQWRKFN